MTTMNASADRCDDLRKVYLQTFDSFAINAEDVQLPDAKLLLNKLVASGLVVAEHINDATALTYQAAETYDSISRSTAVRRFDKTFPKGQPVEIEPIKNGHKGATGPTYTAEQLAAGADIRRGGASWRRTAETVGVKSPVYFSKRVRDAHKVK